MWEPTLGRLMWLDRFNSRAHGGRDPDRLAKIRLLHVSIHAPTGGATPT